MVCFFFFFGMESVLIPAAAAGLTLPWGTSVTVLPCPDTAPSCETLPGRGAQLMGCGDGAAHLHFSMARGVCRAGGVSVPSITAPYTSG